MGNQLRIILTKNCNYEIENKNSLGLRCDGRMMHEIRHIDCNTNVISSAVGSSFFKMGDTKILATIYEQQLIKSKVKRQFDKDVVRLCYSWVRSNKCIKMITKQGAKETSLLIVNALRETLILDP